MKLRFNCKSLSVWLIAFVILFIVLSVTIIIGVRNIINNANLQLIQSFGFETVEEYEQFVANINKDFDESKFLTDCLNEQDRAYAMQLFNDCLELKNGEKVFNKSCLFEVDKITQKGDIILKKNLSLNGKNLGCLVQKIFESVNDGDNAISDFVTIKQLDYVYENMNLSSINAVFSIDEDKIKKDKNNIKDIVPQKLFVRMSLELSIVKNKFELKDFNLQINDLDDNTMQQVYKVIKVFLDKNENEFLEWVGGVIIEVINEVFGLIDCNICLDNDIINLKKVEEV